MSRAYRIRVRESLRTVIRARDRIRAHVQILAVLPAEQMQQIWSEHLKREGYELVEDESGLRAREELPGGILVDVNIATGEVAVSAAEQREMSLEDEQEGRVAEPDQRGQVEERVRQEVQDNLQNQADREEAEMQSRLSDHLEAALGDIFARLDRTVNRATAEALKRKAAEMGRIKEMTEDTERGSLTIVLDVSET